MTREPAESNASSHGYEGVARAYREAREARRIGADVVRAWARELPARAEVLDLGCGAGDPVSTVIREEGHALWAIDASPTLLDAYRARFPEARVACEPVETSTLFGRAFDGVAAIGLLFLLPEAEQRALLARLADAVRPGGRLLFSAPRQRAEWIDLMTGRPSVSLGAEAYREALDRAGFDVVAEPEDEGENHHYSAKARVSVKGAGRERG